MIETTTNAGLHLYVAERVLARYARPGMRAADLGAGPGAMAERLHSFGCDVVAADPDVRRYKAQPPGCALRSLAAVFPGDALLGDNHILVVESLP